MAGSDAQIALPPTAGAERDPAADKQPELVIDPKHADAVLVRDIVATLRERFDLEVVANRDHVRSWEISR